MKYFDVKTPSPNKYHNKYRYMENNEEKKYVDIGLKGLTSVKMSNYKPVNKSIIIYTFFKTELISVLTTTIS